jgi:hypothetical protein
VLNGPANFVMLLFDGCTEWPLADEESFQSLICGWSTLRHLHNVQPHGGPESVSAVTLKLLKTSHTAKAAKAVVQSKGGLHCRP